ncbi:MAG: hypothetical protein IJ572_01345 [Bacilli bacterium]|nr:hypothetical protein [Bacilli bacterium]
MKKNILIIAVIIIAVVLGVLGYFNFINNNEKSDVIPASYIATFHGEVDDVVYETYIYKEENNKFKYVSAKISPTEKNKDKKITSIGAEGIVDIIDEVFTKAEENNAYTYVIIPGDDKQYTIDEYRDKIFSEIVVDFDEVSYDENGIASNYIAIFYKDSMDNLENPKLMLYIYKANNILDNYGYMYILTQSNMDGSIEILERGNLNWSEDVINFAKEKNIDSYVTVKNDDTKYTLEEYSNNFLNK